MTEKTAVLFNPGARQGRAAGDLPRLEAALSRYEVPYDLFVTEDEAHLLRLAADLPSRYGRLAAAGGDTTFSLIINEWLRLGISPPLALFPTGSCNDVPRQAGIAGLEDGVRRLRDGTVRDWDAGRVESEGTFLGHFLGQVQAGIGVGLNHYVEARKKDRGFLGRHQTVAGGVGLWRSYKGPDLPLRLTVRDAASERSGEYLLALAGNTGYTAAGFLALPAAKPDDGALDLVLIKRCPFPRFVRLFFLARNGRHAGRPEVEILSAPEFEVESRDPVELQADGRTLVAPDGRRAFRRVKIKALPAALRIIA